jgi:hypothetical protein
MLLENFYDSHWGFCVFPFLITYLISSILLADVFLLKNCGHECGFVNLFDF